MAERREVTTKINSREVITMKNSKPEPQVRTISIKEWCELNRSEPCITARILLDGGSMYPLIRRMQDYVTVHPLDRKIRKGDIVLFKRADGRHVVHRVRRIKGQAVCTMGDNCALPDREITADCVLGYITRIERGKRTINADTFLWRRIGLMWQALLPLRNFYSKIKKTVRKSGDVTDE